MKPWALLDVFYPEMSNTVCAIHMSCVSVLFAENATEGVDFPDRIAVLFSYNTYCSYFCIDWNQCKDTFHVAVH